MLNNLSKKILEASDVQTITPDLGKIRIIPENIARQLEVVVFDSNGTTLHILTTNKFTEQLNHIYEWITKQNFSYDIYYTSPEWMDIALQWYTLKQKEEDILLQQTTAKKNAKGVNAIAMLQKIYAERESMDPGDFILEMIRLWFQSGASDIHFQPESDGLYLRLRLDGVLQTALTFTIKEFEIYIQKMKFIAWAKMNVNSVPQDGRFSFDVDIEGVKKSIDVRASFMPWMGIESTVLRYLDSTQSIQTFEDIGFWGKMYDDLQKTLKQNYGMILVTWPTGSWKTTTLYSVLNSLNDGKRKIITLEDPVEYKLKGIQQSQIDYTKDYDYAKGLKACLRHDPDIILVWETRTLETAEITLSASLTWHLVFSTLHTNSAIDAINRLTNMGIQWYMLAPWLLMIQGQRLMRKICTTCGTTKKASDTEAAEINKRLEKINEVRPELWLEFNWMLPHAHWCVECNNTGYRWRLAAIEVLMISDKIRENIINNRSNNDIMAVARSEWFLTLQEDGFIKMLKGLTTLEELRRTI